MALLNKNLAAALIGLSLIGGVLSCEWTDQDSEEFYKMLIVGTIIGAIFGIGCIIVASLPLCCGIGKPFGKIIAGVVMAIGIIICFIPAITGKAQGDGAVNKMCDRCATTGDTCNEDDKTKAKEAIGALGILVAYIHAFGFVVIILGATAAGMGCCICCKCCKMKDEMEGGAAGGAVQGQVVGK